MENTINYPTSIWEYNKRLFNGYYHQSEEKVIEGILTNFKLYIPNYKYRPIEAFVSWLNKDFSSKQNRIEILGTLWRLFSFPILCVCRPTKIKSSFINIFHTWSDEYQGYFKFERKVYTEHKEDLIKFLKQSDSISEIDISMFVAEKINKRESINLTVGQTLILLYATDSSSPLLSGTIDEKAHHIAITTRYSPDTIKQYLKGKEYFERITNKKPIELKKKEFESLQNDIEKVMLAAGSINVRKKIEEFWDSFKGRVTIKK